ncbi:siroheme synthase CysG [uncultured Sulfitobacter sp.]|uniref:siroheme synthase CysG n=1 Tax=uncultured Sulfitobacter sp. TaxID=191468 RepID=UPI002626D9C1|nr:siroheme synthase CysG [uncultured Sulfitobacter sp.]
MQFFPVYMNTTNKRIVVSGAGACALAKIRLLIRTEAEILVSGEMPDDALCNLDRAGRITLLSRPLEPRDLDGALLLYAANDDAIRDSDAAALGRAAGVPTLIVDNTEYSDFITPAIVDRDPVTVAIGTEGAAPVLARKIKADVEEMLPASIGSLARLGKAFRPVVKKLPAGRRRREFWSKFYFGRGPDALVAGEQAVERALHGLLDEMNRDASQAGHVTFVGAGPGDPELLTLKARKMLHEADVVLHDALVPQPILDLARREAVIVEVGKTGFGPSWRQEDINTLLVEHAKSQNVVRLKSGDSGVFGRMDEEIDALELAGIGYSVVPGITSAAAAAATIGASLTQRGRNAAVSIFSAHDVNGFSEQDWARLALPGAVAGIYMGKAMAEMLRGRLLMHGARPDTPVTIVARASQPGQQVIPASLLTLPDLIRDTDGPAILLLGLAPRTAQAERLLEAL